MSLQPKPLTSPCAVPDIGIIGHNKAQHGVTALIAAQERTLARAEEILLVNKALRGERDALRAMTEKLQHEKALLSDKLSAAEHREDGHDYVGPTSGGVPVPDVVHERFHKSIGDVLAGNALPKAREQMRDALNQPPAAVPQTTTKGRPLPKGAIGFSHQRIGIYLP